MAYSYNEQSAGDGVTGSKFNAATAALGRVTDVGLYPVQSASYVVFKVGSTYYRRNGSTGQVDDSDSDAVSVIQAAINACTSGGLVFIKAGTYPIFSPIVIGDYITLAGEGPYATTLTLADSVDDNIIESSGGEALNYAVIRDLYLYGNKANNAAGKGIDLFGAQRCSILNCRIESTDNNGIEFTGDVTYPSGVSYVAGNFIYDCGLDGIFLGGFTSDIHLVWNDVGDSDVSNIVLSSADSNTVKQNIIWGAQGGMGIDLYNVVGCGVVGNRVDENLQYGIRSTGSNNIVIVGNNVYNNGRSGSGTFSGIVIDGTNTGQANPGTGHVVTGNRCYAFQDYGIEEINGADYNTIKANDCRGNVTAGYAVIGANNNYDGKARTATSTDLSAGSAETLICLHTEEAIHLARATILYTEATSNNTGVTLEIGKETDRNYYYTGDSANGGSGRPQWYSETVTLLANDVAAGDTVTFYNPGGKTGTGEAMLIIDYLTGV